MADRLRQTKLLALCLLLLIAGAAGAWRVHLILYGRPDANAGEAPPAVLQDAATSTSTAGAPDDPLAAAGLEALEGEPGGIAPPSEAQRTLAFQRRSDDGIQQHASYVSPGTPDEAASHYSKAFAAAGLVVLDDSMDEQHSRVIVARGGDLRIIVVLRAEGSQAKITLTAVRSSPKRDDDAEAEE